MEKIKIATLNVRGFATSKEKREHIFQFILQNKIDITLLTETNVKEVHIPKIKTEWFALTNTTPLFAPTE